MGKYNLATGDTMEDVTGTVLFFDNGRSRSSLTEVEDELSRHFNTVLESEIILREHLDFTTTKSSYEFAMFLSKKYK